MRRILFLIVFCGLSCCCTWSAISEVTAAECTAAANKCNLGAHLFGDIEIGISTRANNTAPAIPANYKQIYRAGGSTWSLTVAYRVLNGTETTTGTFTNGTTTSALVLRGADISFPAIGGQGAYSTAGVTIKYCGTDGGTGCGTLSFTRSDGTSWLIGVGSCASCTAGNVAPTGMTLNSGISTTTLAISTTGAGVSAWTTQSVTVTTTGSIRAVTFEILAAPAAFSTCSTNCPTLIQDRNYGSNDGNGNITDLYFAMPEPAVGGTGNLLICGYDYDGTVAGGPTLTMADDGSGNSWTVDPVSDDGVHLVGFAYAPNVSAGTQNLHVHLSGSGAPQWHMRCSEFAHVGAVHGSPTGISNGNTPVVNLGSVSATANDLIYTVASPTDGYFGSATTNPVFAAQPGWNLLSPDPWQATMGAFAIPATTTSYVVSALLQQPTGHTAQIAAILFNNSASGTLPSAGMRIACMGYTTDGSGTASPWITQAPCPITWSTPNLIVVTSNSDTCCTMTITDTDSNTYHKAPDVTGDQMFYAGTAFANSNTRYMKLTMSVSTRQPPLQWYIITGADASPYDIDGEAVGSQTVAGGATCASTVGANTSVSITPTAATGMIFIVNNNGHGPECAAAGSGNVFDAWWYSGQGDGDAGFTASSGYGHRHSTGAIPQTFTFWWANSAASSYDTGALAVKAGSMTGPGPHHRISQ